MDAEPAGWHLELGGAFLLQDLEHRLRFESASPLRLSFLLERLLVEDGMNHAIRLVATGMMLIATLPEALAQADYPTHPVRIIVPTAPGAGNDTVARLVAQGLSERMGRQVVVENRAGAGTTIGTELVARSAPDGYTLLMTVVAFAINPATYKKLRYDALRDFAPITQALFVPNMMAVHPSVPARSVKDIIALAKARPGELFYSSGGHGTNSHMATALFAIMAGIRLTHVPYKGATPAMTDLIAGHVALQTTSVSSIIPHVRARRLHALGVTSERRVAITPDIPTIIEAGLPGYETVQWSGLLAPAGTPRDIITRLHKETVAVLRTPATTERLARDGSEIVAGTPEAFAELLSAEVAKWARVVKAAAVEPQ